MSATTTWPDPTLVTVGATDDGPVQLAVHEAGPADGVPVVLCHGFPELAFSWRHQLAALADAGFRAIAPDMRGYGGSTAPDPIEAYALPELCGDLAGLLDALAIERAVFVGHDWGGAVTWSMPLLHPERCLGVVGVCTPFIAFPTTDFLRQVFGDDPEAMYMLWFQEPGVAEASMDPRVEEIFDRLLRGGVSPETLAAARAPGEPLRMNPFLWEAGTDPAGEPLGTAAERQVYVDTYRRTGFRGGVNWYRNLDRNPSLVPDLGVGTVDVPALMLCADWDFALPPSAADGTAAHCTDYERHDIPEAGHWVTQDQPEALNALLVDWLVRRFGS